LSQLFRRETGHLYYLNNPTIYFLRRTIEGVELGNKFEDSTFKTLLEFIYQNIEPENELNLETDKTMKMADLEQLTNLNRHQVGFVVRTFTHILRNSLQFIMKPSDLKTVSVS
jgi:hypothetical protein